MATEIIKVSLDTPLKESSKFSKFELWDHQKRMLTRCTQIENAMVNTKEPIGILADRPGTGKTFVALSIILNDLTNVNLIVVPQNIFVQWDEAIQSFCDLNVVRYKSFTTYSDITEIYKDNNIFKNLDIILTTSLYYHLVSGTINSIKSITLNRVFFDEIDTINNMIRDPIDCKFIWFISASFKENKIGCYSLNNISKRICICEDEVIDESIKLTPPKNEIIPCYNLFTEMVKDILPQKTISELNALDFNTNTYKYVTKVPINEREYLEYLLVDLKEIIINNEVNIKNLYLAKKEMEESGFFSGLILQQKSNSFIQQIQLSQNTIEGAKILKKQLYERLRDKQICPLTFTNLENGNKLVSKCCKMCYFKDYFSKINTDILCSLCEKPLKYPTSYLEEKKLISRKPKENRNYKIDSIKEIILKLNKQKNIIFSDFPAIFKTLEDFLKDKDIHFITLDGGSIESLNKAVIQYKNGSTSFLLVDSSMNGCGMNFENTENIIFIHKTNPELENQVIGRAQRPGRKSTLNIYRLLHPNEQ